MFTPGRAARQAPSSTALVEAPGRQGYPHSHGGGESGPGARAKNSQLLSERAKGQGQDCLVPKQMVGMAGLFHP